MESASSTDVPLNSVSAAGSRGGLGAPGWPSPRVVPDYSGKEWEVVPAPSGEGVSISTRTPSFSW